MSGPDVPTISALPAADQFSKSDETAASCGSDNRLGGLPPACPLASTVPCDIDELVLVEIAATRVKKYHVHHGEFIEEPPAPKRGIRLFDVEKQWPKHPTLQVVGDRPGASSPTNILASVSAFATCGPTHASVVMFPPPGQSEISKTVPAGVQDVFTFEAARYQSSNSAVGFFERFITWGIDPVSYMVSVTSCGNRLGAPANGGGGLTVEVYPADQYQLKVSIPAKGKVAYSRARTITSSDDPGEVNITDSSKLEGNIGGLSFERSDEFSTDDGLTLKDEMKYEPQELTFEFNHNGQSGDDVSVNITKLLKMLESAKEAIKALKDFLHDWVPQAGFKFEFSLSFFAGDIALAWGYKEHTDWRVFYCLSGKFGLKIFSIDLSLSFGIQVPGLLVRIEGTVGGELVLESQFDFNTPDSPIAINEKVELAIPAKVKGRAQAGIGWASVAVEVGVRTGFVTGASLTSDSNTCKLKAEVKWAGIIAYLSTYDPNGGQKDEEVELAKERPIWPQEEGQGEFKF